MILIPLLPVIVWAFVPQWFRPWMRVAAALLLVLALVVFARRLRSGHAMLRDTPSRADWLWRARWGAGAYRRHLMNHLEESGWTVLHSALPDEDRVQITCERGRTRAVLLCVRPGRVGTADDQAMVSAQQTAYGAGTTLLVDSPVAYATLADAEVIGGGARYSI